MAILSGRSLGARVLARRPASVGSLRHVAAHQALLATELRDFKDALARERAGIRAELTGITARIDACEARIDSLEERVDLLIEALSGAGSLARESRRRLLRVEEAVGLAGDSEPAGDHAVRGDRV
jgi:hypothetical protein